MKFRDSYLFRLNSWILLLIISHGFFSPSVFSASPWIHKSYQKQFEKNEKVEQDFENPFTEKNETPDSKPNVDSSLDRFNLDSKTFSSELQARKETNLKIPQSDKEILAAVLDVYSTSLSSSEILEISSLFRREIRNTGKFLVYSKTEMKKALGKNLDQEIVAARRIDEYVTQARRLYDDFKFDSAEVVMKEAMKIIPTFDATPSVARKISEAYLTYGLIYDAQGHEKEANGAFLNAAALDPDRQLDPTQYPPSVIGKFYKAKSDFPKIRKGSLRIETIPPVARVVLGDKALGTTPSTLKDLHLGIQKISLFKEGFDPWEKNVMIVASSEDAYVNRLEVGLNRIGESISLDALIGEMVSRKDYDSQISKMADVGKLLGVDQIFAARIEKGEKVYDLFVTQVESRSGRELARGYASIDPNLSDIDVGFSHLLSDLFSQKTPQKMTDRIAVEGKGSHYLASYYHRKPFYKRWPFFLIVGLAAAGGGAGAVIALTRGGHTGSATLSGSPQP